MRPARVNPAKRQPARATVLVAEDDRHLLGTLSALLANDGYDVVEAGDASAMLSYVAGSADVPDVIVSDVCMPGKSGIEAVVELRARGIRAPVVLMTGFPEHCDAASARQAGAVTLIAKPVEIDDLRMIVLNLIPATKG
jgi:DNA-binding NtrC family response regulator